MSSNTQPQFCAVGNISSTNVTAAWAESEAGFVIGTTGFLAFTAGSNDSWVDFLRWMATASAAATSTTATVGRIWVSSITSGTTTTSNTSLIYEVTLPSVSAASSTTPTNPVDVPLGFRLKTGYSILVTNHAAPAASTQWQATVFGGDY